MKIGDKIYWATFGNKHELVTCPDCSGNKRLTVIMGDGEEISIECPQCQSGCHAPTGLVSAYQYKGEVKTGIISGKSEDQDGIEYKVQSGNHSYWCVKEEDACTNNKDAQKRADKKAFDYGEKEKANFLRKEKHDRTWGWNATYHRKCIKQAKHDLEYHSKKLNIAVEKQAKNKRNK